MPLLAPRSINRLLLTLEAGGEITSSPAGLLGWIFTVSHPFALAAAVTYAARAQPRAGLRSRVSHLSLRAGAAPGRPGGLPDPRGNWLLGGNSAESFSFCFVCSFFLLLLLNEVFVAFALFR